MIALGAVEMAAVIVLAVLFSIPLGLYIARVFSDRKRWEDRFFDPIERLIFRITRIDQERDMSWKRYAVALLLFNALGIILVYAIQRLQGHLPLNPQGFGAVSRSQAFNTAASFVTNTNWQSYAGETTMSSLTQMIAMTVQNFLSAATGIAVVVALTRGLVRKKSSHIGNFWIDVVKTTVRLLLPLAIIFAIFLSSQGVVQDMSGRQRVETLEGEEQVIATGPVASQESIKMLGSNGGGFFNANSSHPYENPNPLTNVFQVVAILLIPMALAIAFGKMVGNWRQGAVVFAAMFLIFIAFLGVNYWSETRGNPEVAELGVRQPTAMEGKEVRFGVPGSSLFSTSTTAVANGAVNNMHDSATPIGGMVAMLNIMLGEVVFGGVGAGLYGMLVFVILTVFIIGLMVGRTPEYLGKKIESWEVKMSVLAILIPSAVILIGSSIAISTLAGKSSILNPGPHGLSEVIYAYSSAAGNNGSAFAGLQANTVFYNVSLGIAILIGRYGVILPVLAIAGSLARKKATPEGAGTFRTTSPLFSVMLAIVTLIIGALTFFPALALGPIVEHLMM